MNILFLGDSLVEFFDWQVRFPAHRVINLGIAGESVEGLLSRVVKIREACPDADMVCIMSGINNVAMGDTDFLDFYGVIIEKLTDFYPGAIVLVHSLLPSAVEFISNASVIDLNGRLKALAKSKGVRYLDLHQRFVMKDGSVIREYLLDDGVHLSRQGYDVWSRCIEDEIA